MKKKTLLGALAVLVLAALLCITYAAFGPKSISGDKHITIAVAYSDGTVEDYALDTAAEDLKEAADAVLTLEGEDGPYGFTILAVNGREADFEKEEAYWAIYVNGAYGQYAVDQQPIADGDKFLFAYETT